ncbi:MAG: HTTM domain-containing protein [Acidobacteriota bacterium]
MNARFRRGWERFWDELPLEPTRVSVFRVTFFTLLAIDVWRRLGSSAMYGADGFNVSHLTPIDAWVPVPTAGFIVVLRLLQIGLAIRVAFGGAPRWAVPLLATSFGVTYFLSQLDGYQHHYLIWLLLVILSFVDWSRPLALSWPYRLLLVQLSITYVWTAVTKMEPSWVDGSLIARQVSGETLQDLTAFASAKIAQPLGSGWALSAISVLVLELFLAVALQFAKLRPWAWLLGMALHFGIEMAGLKIGLFSWYLFSLYVLILPAPLGRWIAAAWSRLVAVTSRVGERAPMRWAGERGRALHHWMGASAVRPWHALAVGLILAAWVIGRLPIAGAITSAVVLTVVALAAEWGRLGAGAASRSWRALVQLTVAAVFLITPIVTDSVAGFALVTAQELMRKGRDDEAVRQLDIALGFDHPPAELLHGMAAKIREGESTDLAKLSYQRLLQLDPEHFDGTVDLAHLHRRDGDWSRAAALYARAAELAPEDPRPRVLHGVALQAGRAKEQLSVEEVMTVRELFLGAGRDHELAGESRRALDAFTRDSLVDPGSEEAQRAVARLSGAIDEPADPVSEAMNGGLG